MLLWLVPVGFMAVWYGLSANDINMGTRIFSRDMHDMVFTMYGNILGVEPGEMPGLLLKTLIFDTFLIGAIVAFKMRKRWWPTVSAYWRPEIPASGQGSLAE